MKKKKILLLNSKYLHKRGDLLLPLFFIFTPMKKRTQPENYKSREKYEFTMAAASISFVAIVIILVVYAIISNI